MGFDPALGRFVQPDSIIPDPASSKGFDRYAYVNNNPINFNDPSGHTPTLVTAAIGLLLGVAVNYTLQVITNVNSNHMDLGLAMSFSNIDKKSLTISAVGGFVGGLTLGASTALCGAIGLTEGATTIVTGVVGGSVSNLLAGQVEALTGAAIDHVSENTTLQGSVIHFEPDSTEFLTDAKLNGFGSGDKMVYDAGVGAILGGLGVGLNSAVNELGIPDPLFLHGEPAPWIRPATYFIDYLVEHINQSAHYSTQSAE